MDDHDGPLRGFGRRLHDQAGFIEIAKLVCHDTASLFGIQHCSVNLRASSGRPVLTVDNVAELSDEQRLAWIHGELWRREPMYQAMLEHHGPIAAETLAGPAFMELARSQSYSGNHVHVLLLPIMESAGLLGTIRCGNHTTYSQELQRDLVTLSTLVSVRLAHLGVTASADTPAVVQLTRRQHDVVRLAARGYTNDGIAEHLKISRNTVKNRMKEAFYRLDVSSRVELVRALHESPPMIDIPVGITHDGMITITRAEIAAPQVREHTPTR